MILKKNDHSYTTHKKRIQGKGFIDSLSSTLRNIGSYVSQNKDLLAKTDACSGWKSSRFRLNRRRKEVAVTYNKQK